MQSYSHSSFQVSGYKVRIDNPQDAQAIIQAAWQKFIQEGLSKLVEHKAYYSGLGAYSSTKYALNSLMFTARKELVDSGIIVCVFMPKLTDTGFGNSSLGEKFDIKGAGKSGANVDTPQDVAIKILEQIESEEAEVTM
jgi:NAD(P)-dependent dehydrogenase (short-subunit alcohol dehydrogenase family)